MKNKNIYLLIAILTTFSLSSCAKHERKIDAKAGKEIVETANKASNVYFSNLANQNFFSCELEGYIKGKNNFEIIYETLENENKKENKKNIYEFDTSFIYQGNHDVKNINSKPISLTNTNAFLSLNYMFNNNEVIDKGLYKISQNGTDLNIYNQHLEEKPITKPYRLTDDQVEDYAETFTYLTNDFSIEKIIQDYIFDLDDIDYQRIKLQYEKFENKQVDAQEFVDYVDLYVFSQEFFDKAPEGTYETVVKLFENIEQIDPSNFFDYTKVSNKDITTIKAKLDYKEWGISISNTLNKIVKELKEENSSFDMISNVQKHLINNLPNELALSYSLTINKENVIKDISFDLIMNGNIEDSFSSLSNVYPSLENATLNYDIELSFAIKSDFKEEKIEVNTL